MAVGFSISHPRHNVLLQSGFQVAAAWFCVLWWCGAPRIVGVGAGSLASIVVVGDGREAEKQAVLPRDPGY